MTTGPKLLMVLGLLLLAVGLLWAYSPGTLRALFGWFGHLPGDVRYRSGSVSVFFPWVSLLVLSLGLNVLLRLLR